MEVQLGLRVPHRSGGQVTSLEAEDDTPTKHFALQTFATNFLTGRAGLLKNFMEGGRTPSTAEDQPMTDTMKYQLNTLQVLLEEVKSCAWGEPAMLQDSTDVDKDCLDMHDLPYSPSTRRGRYQTAYDRQATLLDFVPSTYSLYTKADKVSAASALNKYSIVLYPRMPPRPGHSDPPLTEPLPNAGMVYQGTGASEYGTVNYESEATAGDDGTKPRDVPFRRYHLQAELDVLLRVQVQTQVQVRRNQQLTSNDLYENGYKTADRFILTSKQFSFKDKYSPLIEYNDIFDLMENVGLNKEENYPISELLTAALLGDRGFFENSLGKVDQYNRKFQIEVYYSCPCVNVDMSQFQGMTDQAAMQKLEDECALPRFPVVMKYIETATDDSGTDDKSKVAGMVKDISQACDRHGGC